MPRFHTTHFHNSAGQKTTFGYDRPAVGRAVLSMDALGQRVTQSYSSDGRLEATVDGRGVRITHSYDAAGWPTLRVASDGRRVTQVFDPLGSRTELRDVSGLTTFTYDTLRRLQSVRDSNDQLLQYGYDSRSQRVTMTDAAGGLFTYSYDALGRTAWLQNPLGELTTFSYDRTRRSGLQHGNDRDNLLFGDEGDDEIAGAAGHDLIIGSLGADSLAGGVGEDLLLAGVVAWGDEGLFTALGAIHAEWRSARSYADRVANISGTGTGARENGNHFLVVGGTVLDDADVDLLAGDDDLDWFLYSFFADLFDNGEPEQGEIETDLG